MDLDSRVQRVLQAHGQRPARTPVEDIDRRISRALLRRQRYPPLQFGLSRGTGTEDRWWRSAERRITRLFEHPRAGDEPQLRAFLTDGTSGVSQSVQQQPPDERSAVSEKRIDLATRLHSEDPVRPHSDSPQRRPWLVASWVPTSASQPPETVSAERGRIIGDTQSTHGASRGGGGGAPEPRATESSPAAASGKKRAGDKRPLRRRGIRSSGAHSHPPHASSPPRLPRAIGDPVVARQRLSQQPRQAPSAGRRSLRERQSRSASAGSGRTRPVRDAEKRGAAESRPSVGAREARSDDLVRGRSEGRGADERNPDEGKEDSASSMDEEREEEEVNVAAGAAWQDPTEGTGGSDRGKETGKEGHDEGGGEIEEAQQDQEAEETDEAETEEDEEVEEEVEEEEEGDDEMESSSATNRKDTYLGYSSRTSPSRLSYPRRSHEDEQAETRSSDIPTERVFRDTVGRLEAEHTQAVRALEMRMEETLREVKRGAADEARLLTEQLHNTNREYQAALDRAIMEYESSRTTLEQRLRDETARRVTAEKERAQALAKAAAHHRMQASRLASDDGVGDGNGEESADVKPTEGIGEGRMRTEWGPGEAADLGTQSMGSQKRQGRISSRRQKQRVGRPSRPGRSRDRSQRSLRSTTDPSARKKRRHPKSEGDDAARKRLEWIRPWVRATLRAHQTALSNPEIRARCLHVLKRLARWVYGGGTLAPRVWGDEVRFVLRHLGPMPEQEERSKSTQRGSRNVSRGGSQTLMRRGSVHQTASFPPRPATAVGAPKSNPKLKRKRKRRVVRKKRKQRAPSIPRDATRDQLHSMLDWLDPDSSDPPPSVQMTGGRPDPIVRARWQPRLRWPPGENESKNEEDETWDG